MRALFVFAVLSGLCGACCSTKSATLGQGQSSRTGGSGVQSQEPCAPRSADVNAAMTAVYYHAYELGWRPRYVPPLPLPVMSLNEATKIVHNLPSPDGDTKRRRAIGILIAAGTPPSNPRDPWTPPEIDKALRELRRPKLEAFNGAFCDVRHV